MRTRKHIPPEGLREFFDMGNEAGFWKDDTMELFELSSFDKVAAELDRDEVKRDEILAANSEEEEISMLPKTALNDLRDSARRRAVEHILRDKTPRFKSYIWGAEKCEQSTDIDYWNAAVRYKLFYQRCVVINAIIRFRQNEGGWIGPNGEKNFRGFSYEIEVLQDVRTDDRGRIYYAPVYDLLLQWLPGERVGVCMNCENVFYAERLKAKYCSEKCGTAFRQLKWQSVPENRKRHLENKALAYRAKRLQNG